eukprot:c10301_g1_i2.p1 GENE.c10301_g1_i2~~c10301_g1_i2.p1  ORF type:complete len:145 (-),score=29.55 c10301_g1_i2:22-456(-)
MFHDRLLSYDKALEKIRIQRPVARPNPAFMCQLIEWRQRLQSGPASSRLSLVQQLPEISPPYLVARHVYQFTPATLVSTTAAVLQSPLGKTYVWLGEHCPAEYRTVAHRHAARVVEHEHGGEILEISQRSEDHEFWSEFGGVDE